MIIRQDCIVLQQFTVYANGSIFDDGTMVFANEKLADAYLQEYWYNRYGEDRIRKYNGDGTIGNIHTSFYYVEVSELGLRDGSDVSCRCFDATWQTLIKSERDMR